jgi:hypothetical protein
MPSWYCIMLTLIPYCEIEVSKEQISSQRIMHLAYKYTTNLRLYYEARWCCVNTIIESLKRFLTLKHLTKNIVMLKNIAPNVLWSIIRLICTQSKQNFQEYLVGPVVVWLWMFVQLYLALLLCIDKNGVHSRAFLIKRQITGHALSNNTIQPFNPFLETLC